MNSEMKVALLQALLDNEIAFPELLKLLDSIAKDEMGAAGGLPLYHDPSVEIMILKIKTWLCQQILKV